MQLNVNAVNKSTKNDKCWRSGGALRGRRSESKMIFLSDFTCQLTCILGRNCSYAACDEYGMRMLQWVCLVKPIHLPNLIQIDKKFATTFIWFIWIFCLRIELSIRVGGYIEYSQGQRFFSNVRRRHMLLRRAFFQFEIVQTRPNMFRLCRVTIWHKTQLRDKMQLVQ